jgi:mitochondrial import receptor subunit TOM40
MFSIPKAKCAGNIPEASLDDPAFSNIDAHPKFDDLDKMEEGPMPHSRRPPRRPMGFDSFMNPVKLITKKFEQVKGFKFEVTGPAFHKFLMSHSWTITPQPQTPQPPGHQRGGQTATYMLSLQYIGGDIDPYNPVPQAPAFILTGRMDSMGKLESAFMKNFDERTQLRISAGFPNSDVNMAMLHCDLEYEGDDYVHTFKYGTNMWGFNYMQTIGRRLWLGFELLNMSDRKQSLLSGAFKYSFLKHSFYGNYSALQNLLTFAYQQKVSKNVQIISEFNVNPVDGETKTVLGYRQKFNTTEVIATVNSKGKINSILSLASSYFQLKLCASADYQKDSYKFGYGISFGQPN